METKALDKPRGWCHCRDSDRMHYFTGALPLCGKALRVDRPFTSATLGSKGRGASADAAPKCRECDVFHLLAWCKAGGPK